MIFDIENWLFDSLTLLEFSKFDNSIWLQLIFSQKPLVLYPSFENCTTGIVIISIIIFCTCNEVELEKQMAVELNYSFPSQKQLAGWWWQQLILMQLFR